MSSMEDFKKDIDEFFQIKAAFEEAEADSAPEFDPSEYAAEVSFFAWKTKVVYDGFLKQGFTHTEAKDFIVALLKNGNYRIL